MKNERKREGRIEKEKIDLSETNESISVYLKYYENKKTIKLQKKLL